MSSVRCSVKLVQWLSCCYRGFKNTLSVFDNSEGREGVCVYLCEKTAVKGKNVEVKEHGNNSG